MGRRLATFLGALGFTLVTSASGEPPSQRVSRVNDGWPVADFTLTDQRGKPFTRKDLLGKWTLLLFGDTSCGEPCDAALSALTGMCQRISRTQKAKTTQVVFVSTRGETPEQLRQYLAPFDARFAGVTGPSQTVRDLATDLGVGEAPDAPSGSIANSTASAGSLALVDPNGIVWGQFLPPFDTLQLTARYLKTRAGR